MEPPHKRLIDFNRAPFLVIWEVTRACALACVHCRADAIARRDPRELSTGEGFALLAPYVVSAHAKDIVMKGGPGRISFHMDEVPPGEGMLDYRAYLRELDALGRVVPLFLEHFDKPEFDRGRDYIRKGGREIGVEV